MTHLISLQAIQEQSIKNPDSIAVCHDDQSFSYRDLEKCANRLAHYLERHEVHQGEIVALYMRRSFDVLVGMLAVWKVGAAYLSLDFETPLARLKGIINQANPKCIVTEPALLNNLSTEIPLLTCHDLDYFKCDDEYHCHDERLYQEPAYLIYTSGSTGQPKGVLVNHANLSNYLFWFNEHFKITHQDIFIFNSSPAFDFAVTCIHAPLAAGARIVITSEADVLDIETYCHQLIENKVTFVKWTPSYFKFLVQYVEKKRPNFSSLRYLMIAGEELLTAYVERWYAVYPSHAIINEYGPTETTVGITTNLLTKSNLDRTLKTVPIGQAVRNSRLYVVDENNRPVEQGEVGELLIGGASVACGYYKAPELTRERFIKNPFSAEDDILYRTGDLVKQLPDKSFLYLGRIDNQVKINGYRVELNEVEYCLLRQTSIEHAYILAKKHEDGHQSLEAYVVLKPQATFNEAEIRNRLSQQLPQFMIPQHYYLIDRIPLTPNGKVDHSALVQMRKLGVKENAE
ncbi:amino acid adenylation domain-containing protein [Coxiella burnetii]|uniref:amino acid adenylation domain-containing protein n=1 Tax=Coxiella burnetii TaxID=777 RepID=UPI000183CE9C|nr:amino acid adenylation domain-containing protein [Coxiella burnetii]ACJ18543.1 peptide synthetase [Coxiella burnetii CbuG_Q212]ATN66925.1 AMP-binding protein [Coxiella burnetii]OYK86248.1 AMP-binding protein [Coxiella burnetii]